MRKSLKSVFVTVTLITIGLFTSAAEAQTPRWPEQKAIAWYAEQPWLVGSNYVPKSAINQLEMWQEATFSPDEIDKELTWAESLGMNTMRVFLHDLLWQQDAAGFQNLISARSIRQFRAFTTPDGCRAPAPRRWPTPIKFRA